MVDNTGLKELTKTNAKNPNFIDEGMMRSMKEYAWLDLNSTLRLTDNQNSFIRNPTIVNPEDMGISKYIHSETILAKQDVVDKKIRFKKILKYLKLITITLISTVIIIIGLEILIKFVY